MSETLLLPPNRNWALFADVSDGSPTAGDPDYELAWLTDGRPGFPLRLNAGSGVLTLTKAAAEVDIVAICHHLLPAALSVAIGGDVSGAIIIPDYPANAVPYNAWTRIGGSPLGSPAEVDTLTLTISQGSPSDDIVIGEVFAGVPIVLNPSLKRDTTRFGVRRYLNAKSGNELSGIPPYSDGARSRPLSGSQYYDEATVQALLDAFDSQDAYAYPVPCLLILDSDDETDARVVTMEEPVITPPGPSGSEVEFLVELTFNEVPRTRW